MEVSDGNDVKLETLRALKVYRINREQIWLAETLESAMIGAALEFGCKVEDIADELCPPKLMGTASSLVYAVDRSMLDGVIAEKCVKLLKDGYMPPVLIGTLAV